MAGTSVCWINGSIGGTTGGVVVCSEGMQGGTGGNVAQSETMRQYTFQDVGVLSNLYFNVITNTSTTNSVSIVRINTANGNGTITITSGTGAGELTDTVHVDQVVANTLYTIQVTGPTGGSWSANVMAQMFTPTVSTNTLTVGCSDGPNTGYVSGTTYYNPIIGQNGNPGTATEAQAQILCPVPFILNNFFVNCDTYTGGATVSVIVRINGFNGNGTNAPNNVGKFIDTTHIDIIKANTLVCFSSVFTSGTYGTGFVALSFLSTDGNAIYASATPISTGITFATSITKYLPFGTRMRNSATESQSATTTNTAFTGSAMQIYTGTNGITAASTLVFRANSTTGNQSLTIGSSVSNVWITDTTHTDSVIASTKICMLLSTGGTGTTLAPTNFSMLATFAPGVPFSNVVWFGMVF